MKKILSVLLVSLMLFSLAACARDKTTPESLAPADSSVISQDIPEFTGEPAAEPLQTSEQPNAPPAAEPTPEAPAETDDSFTENPADTAEAAPGIDENGSYTSRDDVALYIHTYGRLPQNFISKKDAQALGWSGGSLEPYAPGKCIGGSRFGNYEGLLPEKEGRSYTECDIDTLGKDSRGAKRIVFSNDGLIYYTDDHYESFTLLYGEE